MMFGFYGRDMAPSAKYDCSNVKVSPAIYCQFSFKGLFVATCMKVCLSIRLFFHIMGLV